MRLDCSQTPFTGAERTALHNAVRDQLYRRLCPMSSIYGFWALERCARDLRMPDKTGEPMWQKVEADLAIASTGEIYEVKPDNSGQIRKGQDQVQGYVRWLNDAIDLDKENYMVGVFDRDPSRRWHPGKKFNQFSFNYKGHRVFVRYAEGQRDPVSGRYAETGVAAYRTEECGEECDESELQKAEDPTLWYRVSSIPEKFSWLGVLS